MKPSETERAWLVEFHSWQDSYAESLWETYTDAENHVSTLSPLATWDIREVDPRDYPRFSVIKVGR